MKVFLALLAGAFLGLAAAYALPDALAGWFPEPFGFGLLLAGGIGDYALYVGSRMS